VIIANCITHGLGSQSPFADKESGMTYDELRPLSNTEIVAMALHHQAQIEALQTAVTRLEARVGELEARRDLSARGTGRPPTAEDRRGEVAMIKQQKEREQATRDALRHLDEVAYLARSRLAKLIASLHGQLPDGHSVQDALARAIYAMKPAEAQPHQTQERRLYHVLYLTYVMRRKPAEVAQALAISQRQYYRDLRVAIRIVTDRVLGSRP
jgi:hypothetical protein